MLFRHVVYDTSQWKRILSLNITKKFEKENNLFNFMVYFTRVKALILSLTQKNKLQQMV